MRRLIFLLILVVLAPFVRPYINDALFMVRLMKQHPPSALPVPVEGVPGHRLTDSWEARRGEGRKHQGIDIFAPKGTPVQSTTRGVVWRIGQNRLGGNVVWVLGPGGQIHYYAHLDRFAGIKPRDRIGEGVVLGFVGNTGNARGTPPHLHYGIYSLSGKPLNPFPLLKQTQSLTAPAS